VCSLNSRGNKSYLVATALSAASGDANAGERKEEPVAERDRELRPKPLSFSLLIHWYCFALLPHTTCERSDWYDAFVIANSETNLCGQMTESKQTTKFWPCAECKRHSMMKVSPGQQYNCCCGHTNSSSAPKTSLSPLFGALGQSLGVQRLYKLLDQFDLFCLVVEELLARGKQGSVHELAAYSALDRLDRWPDWLKRDAAARIRQDRTEEEAIEAFQCLLEFLQHVHQLSRAAATVHVISDNDGEPAAKRIKLDHNGPLVAGAEEKAHAELLGPLVYEAATAAAAQSFQFSPAKLLSVNCPGCRLHVLPSLRKLNGDSHSIQPIFVSGKTDSRRYEALRDLFQVDVLVQCPNPLCEALMNLQARGDCTKLNYRSVISDKDKDGCSTGFFLTQSARFNGKINSQGLPIEGQLFAAAKFYFDGKFVDGRPVLAGSVVGVRGPDDDVKLSVPAVYFDDGRAAFSMGRGSLSEENPCFSHDLVKGTRRLLEGKSSGWDLDFALVSNDAPKLAPSSLPVDVATEYDLALHYFSRSDINGAAHKLRRVVERVCKLQLGADEVKRLNLVNDHPGLLEALFKKLVPASESKTSSESKEGAGSGAGSGSGSGSGSAAGAAQFAAAAPAVLTKAKARRERGKKRKRDTLEAAPPPPRVFVSKFHEDLKNLAQIGNEGTHNHIAADGSFVEVSRDRFLGFKAGVDYLLHLVYATPRFFQEFDNVDTLAEAWALACSFDGGRA
jgi:hypothetical protein